MDNLLTKPSYLQMIETYQPQKLPKKMKIDLHFENESRRRISVFAVEFYLKNLMELRNGDESGLIRTSTFFKNIQPSLHLIMPPHNYIFALDLNVSNEF